MKKNFSIEEKIAVQEGLKALYIYNKAMKFSLDEAYIDDNVLSEYFLSDDIQFCIDCEKKIGAAASALMSRISPIIVSFVTFIVVFPFVC